MQSLLDLSKPPAASEPVLADAVMADEAALENNHAAALWQDFASTGRPRFLTCKMADFQDEAALFAKLSAWKPSGIHLCDIEKARELDLASTLFRVMEVRLGLLQVSLPLIASLATTATASLNLQTFGRPHPRLTACLFDPQALANNLAITDLNADSIRQVRATVLLVARAAGCLALQRTIAKDGATVYVPFPT